MKRRLGLIFLAAAGILGGIFIAGIGQGVLIRVPGATGVTIGLLLIVGTFLVWPQRKAA